MPNWLQTTLLLAVTVITNSAHALEVLSTTPIPSRELRGYGALSGEFVTYKEGASRLRMVAADAERAGIVHAKFVSDLHLLGGVRDERVTLAGVQVIVRHVAGDAALLAWRRGAVVTVLAAERGADMAGLFAAQPVRERSGLEAEPAAVVPTYLDSWDQHGWRWYYWPWMTPDPGWHAPKRVEWRDYNVLGEFDWAKAKGAESLIFWTKPEMTDLAEGFCDNLFWDWAGRAAALRGLPMVLNTSLESGPTWLLNRWRSDARQMAPEYLGGFYAPGEAWSSGKGDLSWSSGASADEAYEVLQKVIGEYASRDTTLEYLEPHGEMGHGEHEGLVEYGPVADRGYRHWLRAYYETPQAVAARWQRPLATSDDVHLPELASFLGFDADALSLAGRWRLGYAAKPDDAWYQPTFDDSAWPELTAPGSDVALFTKRESAVFRRHFTVDAAWRARHDKVWLYCFDLNRGHEESLSPWLNGQPVGASRYEGPEHWAAFEVTAALHDGDNFLAFRLPQGFLGYRIYLAGHAPLEYPYLGAGKNAEWADFVRFQRDSRVAQLRRGFAAIRQMDPNRSIICMAPDQDEAGIKKLCEQYGGHFHNTGYMSGWWAEPLPMLMRGSDLPFSLEPGSHAQDVNEFKRFFGCWLTEGVNAVHYFIHVGSVLWNPDVKAYFEQQLPLVATVGKVHIPKAELAFLLDDDGDNLTGFPWGRNRGDQLPTGYVPSQMNIALHNDYHSDAVSEQDFAPGGAADGYKVVIDMNGTILDPDTVTAIAGWVKRGGTFVTYQQTGRHTSTAADAWPISALTGYRVRKVETKNRAWSFVEGQDMLDAAPWSSNERRASGLTLEAADPACHDVARWADGSVALGWRSLGQGRVVTIGVNTGGNSKLHRGVLAWLKIKRVPFTVEAPPNHYIATHLVSNNGLYDAFCVWNTDLAKPLTFDLSFREGLSPATCIDVKAGAEVPVTGPDTARKVVGLTLEPGETRTWLTPRVSPLKAGLDWFTLQRNWWRGGTPPGKALPPGKPLPPYKPRFSFDLTESWAVKWLDDGDGADHAALAAPDLDDAAWPRRRLCTWLVPDEQPTHRAVFRRSFTVPANWQSGRVELWLQGWIGDVVQGRYRAWLDGKEIKAMGDGGHGLSGLNLTDRLTPGTRHSLAIEIASTGPVAGADGHTWLYWQPAPQASDDLAGAWQSAKDALTWSEAPVTLPGAFDGLMAKRTVRIDAAHAGQNVVLEVDTDTYNGMTGVIVNGHFVMRHHHDIGSRTVLNITPWVRFGADNEVILKRKDPGKAAVHAVRLDYFGAGVYP
jgi:hypothetical protein